MIALSRSGGQAPQIGPEPVSASQIAAATAIADGPTTMSAVPPSPIVATPAFGELEAHRGELTAHCYRMLGSPFEAEDAVQDTLLRAWRSRERFEGRASVRSWLYRIATNVCLDMLNGRKRRARPMDLGPALAPVEANLRQHPDDDWVQPVPDNLVAADGDPAEVTVARESIRLAFVAALQHLPPRQRAALILCEVLQWKAAEAAELLEMTVAGVNSALQRARATLASHGLSSLTPAATLTPADREILDRYVHAFESYDMDALADLIHEDATQSMPPFSLWLRGREDILRWFVGPGSMCRGSRVIATSNANGSPAFGQYKPSPEGGHIPWALQVLELEHGRVVELSFFLDTRALFPLFGLPERLEG